MQIVHDKVANLQHVQVYLFLPSQNLILLQLVSRHSEKLLEELLESRKVKIIIDKELVTNGRPSELDDKIVD